MKVKRMIKSDVDTFKVGDIIKVKLTDGVKVRANLKELCVAKRLPNCRADRLGEDAGGQLRFA